jgi:multidrug efflux system membrane fusion protein
MKRFALLLPGLAVACARPKAAPPPEAVPVTVATVARRSVPLQIRNVGSVQPVTSVSVRAQVGGELTAVHFREGQDVRQGDPLFTIDPRPYQSQLAQAEAALRRDQAQQANAAANAKRYDELVKKDYVTREQSDQVRANSEALGATVSADRAAVENARLELEYCSIRSPMAGRTGRVMVQRGNIVKPNDAALVTINQISPIDVSFTVPEGELPEIRRRQSAGRLEVVAEDPSDHRTLARGALTFVDNAVDRATGTITLKATFPNADRALWPGEFVEAVLTLSTDRDALVVPASAIQTGQQGSYAWVVKPDDTVESRPVTVARASGDDVVVARGLSAGERVVTDGQLRLAPGARVEIKAAATPAAGPKP